ncbi:transcription factor, MADS-box [Artemisia annua]|uniref:Transcription factor, MADS-box n=1 Tax=Artemisia annua TaxID=35608 RepID=A0A2U1KSJ8_ARTAN|nr:transcription factor, MADS-box [Artemisia annua]
MSRHSGHLKKYDNPRQSDADYQAVYNITYRHSKEQLKKTSFTKYVGTHSKITQSFGLRFEDMGRGKVAMELINGEKKRKLVSIRRKGCLFRKARELATLCDVNVSMIDLSFGLGLKINKVKARIELLKSKKISDFEKLDGRDSLKMPLNNPNPITIMTRIDHNSNHSFVSDICHVSLLNHQMQQLLTAIIQ